MRENKKKFRIFSALLCLSVSLWFTKLFAALPAPSGLAASPANGSVTLQWAPVPGATSYFIQRSLILDTATPNLTTTDTPTPTPTFTPTGIISPTPTPSSVATLGPLTTPVYTDFQVTNGRNYLYQVAATDASGWGLSAPVTALPFAIAGPVQPVAVQNLHSGALDLSWGMPFSSFPVSIYQVYKYTLVHTFTPTGSFTPTTTPTGANTATITPTPTLPGPIPIATLLAGAPITGVTGLSYIDMTPAASGARAVYYAVVAVDSRGTPGSTPTVSTNAALPKNLAPQPPLISSLISASVTPVIGTNGYGVRLFWNGAVASEGVTAYKILQNGTPTAVIPVVPTPLPTYAYDITSIPFSTSAGTFTSYSVMAMGLNGNSSSNTLPQNIFKSSVPVTIQVTPDATADTVKVTWNQGAGGTYGLDGYRVFKSATGLPTPNATQTITPTVVATIDIVPSVVPTLVALDTGVTNAHGLFYWVEPFDALQLGGSVGRAATPALRLAPPPPLGVAAAAPVGNNQVNVSWSSSGSGFYGTPQDYVVYRELLSALTPTPVATVAFPQTSYIDAVPGGPGTAIAYQVAVKDSKGNLSNLSGYSNTVTLAAPTAPATPRAALISGDETSLRLSWVANPTPDNVDSYHLFGSDWPILTITPTPIIIIPPSPTMTFSVPATVWNAGVYYLMAHNAVTFGQPAVLSGIPVPTYGVTAVVIPNVRQVDVSWDMAPVLATSTPEIKYFIVHRSLTPGANFTPIASVTISQTNYSDAGALAGKTYYFRVTAKAEGGGVTAQSPLYPTMAPTPEDSTSTWPNAPVGVAAVGGVTQTTLSWIGNAASENVLSYIVYQNGVATATVTPNPTFSVSFAESPGNVSSFHLVAQNLQGGSDPSGTVMVLSVPTITPTVVLTPPAGFVPTPGVTPIYPKLAWVSNLSYPGDVSGYTVYRFVVLTPGATPTLSAVASVNSPVSFVGDAGVAGYVNHYRMVASAWGLSANPNASSSASVSLWPNPPVFSLGSSASAVSLLWATPVGDTSVTGYTLYRSVYPTTTPLVLAQSTPPAVSYPDAVVTPGRAYIYWMDAQGTGGTSSLSAPQTIIPAQPPLVQITPGAGRNILNWAPVTLATPGIVTGYVVYRAVAPTPGATPVFAPVGSILQGLSNNSYSDTSVTDTVTYIYKVAVSSLTGLLGAFSAPVTQIVLPQPVSNLTAVSGNQVVQLRWTNQGTASSTYTVQRRLGAASDNFYAVIKSGVVGVNYLDTGVQNKTFYTYRLITVDSLGLTAVSQPVNALPARPPVITEPLVTVTQDQNGNTLSWTAANSGPSAFDPQTMYPLAGYNIYRSSDGGGTYQKLNSFPVVSTSYLDPVQVVGGVANTYLVKAVDAPPDDPSVAHETPYSPLLVFPLTPNTALDRNAIKPNGSSNERLVNIRFVVTEPGHVNIKVYSLNGTFVKELISADYAAGVFWTSWDAMNMNGTGVASGVYLISTESPGPHQEFQKVAVIK